MSWSGLKAARRPRHAVGWLLLGLEASIGLTGFTDGHGLYGLLARPGLLPSPRWCWWARLATASALGGPGRSTHTTTPEPVHSELVPACVMTATSEMGGLSDRLDRQNMVEDLVGIPSALRFLELLVVPAVVQLGPRDA
jgi:hypothetical protein